MTQTPLDPFSAAVALVLEREGPMSNDLVNDPNGGLTRFGISQKQNPGIDVRLLTHDAAVAFYRTKYWDGTNCGELPWPLSFLFFDCAVNQGTGTAGQLLQKALGFGAQDGVVGPVTLAAVAKRDVLELTALFCAERILAYAKLSLWANDGRGWAKRVCLNCLDA